MKPRELAEWQKYIITKAKEARALAEQDLGGWPCDMVFQGIKWDPILAERVAQFETRPVELPTDESGQYVSRPIGDVTSGQYVAWIKRKLE